MTEEAKYKIRTSPKIYDFSIDSEELNVTMIVKTETEQPQRKKAQEKVIESPWEKDK